ncbi:hypothetical protein HZA96_00540 [Candidatus Woesearchaeota archaeon]|nr:hypothetical protein [Candidatus Woesearchaeota archaeon]
MATHKHKQEAVIISPNRTKLHLTHKSHFENNDDDKDKHMPKVLKNVFHEHKFNLADGSSLFNLYELAAALKDMNGDVFSHHVNDSKNDFANWVKNVMHEHDLADQLSCIKSKQETEAAVLRHLVNNLAQGPVAHDYMNVNNFFNLVK